MAHFMIVYVDGKPEKREIDHVVPMPRGMMPQLVPKIGNDEEIRRTSQGKVIIFKRQTAGRFLSSVIADWVDGEHETFTAEYSDGSTETWSRMQFDAWRELQDD